MNLFMWEGLKKMPLPRLLFIVMVCKLLWGWIFFFFFTTRVIKVTDSQTGAEDTPRYTGGIIIEFCLKLTMLSAGKVNGNLSAEVTKTARNSAPSMLNLLHRNGSQRS